MNNGQSAAKQLRRYMFTQLDSYPDYEIYSEGYVVSPRGKVLKVIKDRAGYCFVTMKDSEGVYKKVRLHRIVAKAFIENQNDLPEVNHKDGDKSNNSVANLEWVTSKQNKKHAWANNLYKNKTENHYAAVLTNTEVRKICEMLENGVSNTDIANHFDIDKSIVAHIKAGDTWKEISCDYSFRRIKKPRKNIEDVHMLCKYLSEGLDHNSIKLKLPMFSTKDISRVLNKKIHKQISDLYFS